MAAYQYEQLNPESFEQLCQSLLVREYPGLQCYPVGQPDGGRDATFRLFEAPPDRSKFFLFQVKFARRELNDSDARAWLLRTLRDELPKVQTQIREGAERFILVTNVPGTAHHKSGSKDKLQALLEEQIPIPAQAWWADDIDRRLDDAWDLKLAYPAILTGTDFLRLMTEVSPSEGRERRHNTIKAFLSGQFESDREVKFKQTELQNDIFDLFIDVPLVPRNSTRRRQKPIERLATAFHRAARSESGQIDPFWIRQWFLMALGGESRFAGYLPQDEAWLGTASLLLDGDFQQIEPLVILEGAPGQGKSTIAQYICQIHRMRFLARRGFSDIDPAHLTSPLRLPFKVELRDFATWLSGGNPFGANISSDSGDASQRSLEGFLSALVRYASGGSAFDVSDLHATLTRSPALIVLDGLDEVAEINLRQRVVKEITSAVARLNELATSLQVVVTSRPTQFINATVLPSDTFATYSLGSLTRPLIAGYADRWLKSRDIDEVEARNVRQILDTKLDEPHLRDLARNPMQLAILLSLIHRRGISLPDKRTALYDSYIEIFFDRESEKAAVVKKHRDLLTRIHRYLAWELQAGAEIDSESTSAMQRSGTSLSGSISEVDLKILLREYLETDRSDAALVEELFTGMVERVVAIVSRVQGTFEFDVQTLREYFAARHLYETAPYSPAGDERSGTISDRWHALSRNFYWLNVARFYAGCYSEGELASLIDDLNTLSNDKSFRSTSHPQLLTATLLGDWVFSQWPRATEGALNLVLEPRGLRMLMAGAGSDLRHVEHVTVGDSVGRRRLVAAGKELVRPDLPGEQLAEIVQGVLHPNAEPEELFDWWVEELRSARNDQASQWCVIGEVLQCWSIADSDIVKELLDRDGIPARSVIAGLLHANRIDVLENDEDLFETAVDEILAGERVGWSRNGSLLQYLATSVQWMFLRRQYPWYPVSKELPLLEYWSQIHDFEEDITWPNFPVAQRCARVVQAFKKEAERPIEQWDVSLEPWERLIEQGVSEFGERKTLAELANLAAGIRSKEEKCQDSPDLFDHHRPLARRARYARLRAGSRRWWSKQLQSATNSDEVWMALLIFTTWAGVRTIEELAEEFDGHVLRLGTSEWHGLYSSVGKAAEVNSGRTWIKPLNIRVNKLPSSLSPRTVALLAERCSVGITDELYERYLTDYRDEDSDIVSLCAHVQVQRAVEDETKWPQAIEGLRSSYTLGAPTSRILFPHLQFNPTLPDAVAMEVVARPLEFPPALVRAAEACCRQLVAASILPVAQVADAEGWFAN